MRAAAVGSAWKRVVSVPRGICPGEGRPKDETGFHTRYVVGLRGVLGRSPTNPKTGQTLANRGK